MNATQAQLGQTVDRTSGAILDRYRRNRHWRLYVKEYVYHSFPPAGRSWLDFGCGTGEVTTQLAALGASRVIGLDVAPGLVEMARRRAELDQVSDRVQLFCGDVATIEPQPVDVVLCLNVLHHLPDQLAETISMLQRWLRPGGVFISVEPVSYLRWFEWLRQHSGVPRPPLDPGERKLTEMDLRLIETQFRHSHRVHFDAFARFGRLWPKADRFLRSLDRYFLPLPGARWFAGTVIQICRMD